MKKEYFFEMGFRGLTLIFWPIIIYKWIFIPNIYMERNSFLIFSILAIIYIINIGISQAKYKFLDNIVIYYRISTLISFILTLASFLLYPTNITLMWLKVLFIFIYFYISFKNVYTYKIEECVVGMISAVLLLVISICY
ncbi:hypothetical protein QX51_17465 [Terrisporobacter othiniensis]|uniref:Uncharacterized protein n=1 Tax=Terrisporobacter othiniensis TaxID=1577792 RepID=A0A0B3W0I9_9FIRM|nr:hypothetical protein QX51_17465 [Terrisporobacter othiniensis]